MTLLPLVIQGAAENKAYGAAVSGSRGLSVVKLPPPAGARTAISSQRALPANGAAPKSSTPVNSPLATLTALRATVAPTWFPPLEASQSRN